MDFPFPEEDKEAKISKKSSPGPEEVMSTSLYNKMELNLPIIHEHSEKNVSNQSVISSDERSDFSIEKEAQALNDKQ